MGRSRPRLRGRILVGATSVMIYRRESFCDGWPDGFRRHPAGRETKLAAVVQKSSGDQFLQQGDRPAFKESGWQPAFVTIPPIHQRFLPSINRYATRLA